MPRKIQHEDLEIDGVTYRLHRLRGRRAFDARSEIVNTCGLATVMILGESVITPEMREKLRGPDGKAITAMTVIAGALAKGGMSRKARGLLLEEFLDGQVDVKIDVEGRPGDESPDPFWRRLADLAALEAMLLESDGSVDDGLVIATLLWTQIGLCLGPTIAEAGTDDATPATAPT